MHAVPSQFKLAQWTKSNRWAYPAAAVCLATLVLFAFATWVQTSGREQVYRVRAWNTDIPPLTVIAGLQSLLKANVSASYTAQEYESLSKLRQEAFCTDAHPVNMENTKVVKVTGTVNMYLLTNKDFVSEMLLKGKVWEKDDLKSALWALKQPLPTGYEQGSNEALFVDVGANVGAFTFSVASAGYKVLAFEGMHDNQLLLRSSLCESDPVIMSRVTLFPYGAGATHQTCYLIAHESNLGDGIPICNEQDLIEPKSRGYIVRSRMNILPLDWVIQRDVKLMKVDVEGFEPFVMQGAKQLLTQHRVWYIMLEFNYMLLHASLKDATSKKTDFIHELTRLGYAVSSKSFQGPWLSESQFDKLDDSQTSEAFNLYFVHPLLLHQPTAGNRKIIY